MPPCAFHAPHTNLSSSSPITDPSLHLSLLFPLLGSKRSEEQILIGREAMASTIPSASTIFQYQSRAGNPFSSRRRDFVAQCKEKSGIFCFSSIALCKRSAMISFVVREGGGSDWLVEAEEDQFEDVVVTKSIKSSFAAQRSERKKAERRAYLVAAMMSSFGFTSMAAAAVYYRFAWQMEGSEVPLTEMMGTFSLAVGAAVGMEYWARWAHRAVWHASLWHMHESHHRPRDGLFELNDVFAIVNAVPAIALLAFGFFNRGFFPGLCFGAGLGITLFGMAYMFVHDGLVHRRFPVGPIANVPYFQRVAAAHQMHHADKFNGVPYGLFLGHKELEEVGGEEELEKEIKRRIKVFNRSSNAS